VDQLALAEQQKYERMWAFHEYRDDHATAHACAALVQLAPAPGDSVIDFGAGAGYASRYLHDAGLSVLAVDIAPNALAPDIAARVPCVVGNLWDLPSGLVADWGLCCDVMEHIPTEKVDAVLRTLRRCTRRAIYFSMALRPDGCDRPIGESLRLTVQPLEWWMSRLSTHWPRIDVLRHAPEWSVDLVAAVD